MLLELAIPVQAKWTDDARVIEHSMADYWEEIHGDRVRRWLRSRRRRVRHAGNVAYLPPAKVGYRLTQDSDGVVIEVVGGDGICPSFIGRVSSIEVARAAVADMQTKIALPILPEVYLEPR